MNSPVCEDTAPDRSGNPGLEACACTPSFSTPAIPIAFILRSPLLALSAATMAAKAGSRSTRVFIRNTFPIQRRRLEGKLRVFRSRSGGNEWEALTKGLPQKDCYVNVLRDAMAVDTLDQCGIYFGTTGGQVYCSADAGDSWNPIVRDLPAVLSVEVQTLA
jgi:hypothetical protein